MRAASRSAVEAASAPAGGARDASATAARASRIRHPLEHCALAWPCRTYLGFPRQVRMAKLAERFANFGGPEKSGQRSWRGRTGIEKAAGAGGMKWHWHNARCTVPKAGLALLRAWAAVGWQEVGGPWRSEVGPVFIVYKQAASGREARRHTSCQAHTPARCATRPKKPITPCHATLWRLRA